MHSFRPLLFRHSLTQVMPTQYGSPKKWYFFLQRSFWFPPEPSHSVEMNDLGYSLLQSEHAASASVAPPRVGMCAGGGAIEAIPDHLNGRRNIVLTELRKEYARGGELAPLVAVNNVRCKPRPANTVREKFSLHTYLLTCKYTHKNIHVHIHTSIRAHRSHAC